MTAATAARLADVEAVDPDALAALLAGHERRIDYGYEVSECSCGEWDDTNTDDALGYESHLVEVAARLAAEGTDR